MRINNGESRLPLELVDQVREGSQPLLARVDDIVSSSEIRVSLLLDTLGRLADSSVPVRTAPDARPYNSLSTMIKGNDRMPPLVPGDVVGFDDAFVFEGVVYVGDVTLRTHDRMRGPVQVVTAMAKPSLSVVNKKGALQSLIIADGAAGVGTYSHDGVREAFARSKSNTWIGGAPGLIVRDEDGRVVKEFFEEGRETIKLLLEDLDHAEVFKDGAPVELIPAWRLPMGREQVIREVGDPKRERPAQIGHFGRRFVSKETRGYIGFLPCMIVLCEEDRWEFGANTGQKAVVAAGVQPVDALPPVPREKLPSAVRTFRRVPATVKRLYDDQTMEAMAKARLARQPDEPASTSSRPHSSPVRPAPPSEGRPSFNGSAGSGRAPFRR